MPLPIGARIGVYEITGALGEGGMGEVYRARDAKLGREVAIKILPETWARDPDRLARFEREAKTLASLNHPNIAAIYGAEQDALVMELVEGEDLSAHIQRGPLALHDAVPIAKQIAEALEFAHESGIVHRDLKPANIKVRADGTVKVLDFGLAKALTSDSATGTTDSANSPTLTARATQMGMILGTAAYMAPEQARGRAVDRRADIWAFGAVLYEMLSGQRAFEGDDVSITLASVLKEDVKWDALPADLPPALRTLIRRCLEKDPKRRLGWIGEARYVFELPTEALTQAPEPRARRSVSGGGLLPWALAALTITAALAILVAWNPWRATTPAPQPRKLVAKIGAAASLSSLGLGASAILSPDGQTLAFVAADTGEQMLYVRRLNELTAIRLAGTEGASSPFFSPRGDWIAYFTTSHLKRVPVTGGAPVPLCEASGGRGGTWLEDDTIVFAPSASSDAVLKRVPAAGGAPQDFGTFLESGRSQRWPQVLPGGTHVLYSEHLNTTGWDSGKLILQKLSGGPPKVVLNGGYYGRFIPSDVRSGHLIYIQQGSMYAAPFDLDVMEVTGPAFPALDSVLVNSITGAAQFAVSAEGTLVFVPGASVAGARPIMWLTADGKGTPLRTTPSQWSEPRFSPDGKRLALAIHDGKQVDIHVYDLARDSLTQLTFDPGWDRTPVWSPDGQRIAFSSDRAKPGGATNIYVMNADGSGDVARLTTSDNTQVAFSWHPKGEAIFFQEQRPGSAFDLMVLPLPSGAPTVFLSTPAGEVYPSISPDGPHVEDHGRLLQDRGRFLHPRQSARVVTGDVSRVRPARLVCAAPGRQARGGRPHHDDTE